MDQHISEYCSALNEKCPTLARSFQQIVDIRTGECEQDHYIDFGRLTTSSKRVNTAINKQKRLSIPSHGVLWGSRIQFFESTRVTPVAHTGLSRHCYPNSLGTIHRFQNEVDGSSQEARPVRLCRTGRCA
jgi:hypothetical protein